MTNSSTIALIVAMGNNNEIGKNNQLLWSLPKDMQFFKNTTNGHVVIMGRKNWESIPEKFRPLPNRENYVLTRNNNYIAKDALVFTQLEDAIQHATSKFPDKVIFIIGGAEIYNLALENVTIHQLYITHVQSSFDADTYFPKIDLSAWQSELIFSHDADEKNKYPFTVKKYWKE